MSRHDEAPPSRRASTTPRGPGAVATSACEVGVRPEERSLTHIILAHACGRAVACGSDERARDQEVQTWWNREDVCPQDVRACEIVVGVCSFFNSWFPA